ncbi:DUF7336 domain-containing protein [Sphingobacterium siyangense]|uniref:DUF7336 domain-containing protein n=1 Tax=Sphingobacterium siyangense TaxID=459529 RepID=UPI003DA36D18
MEHVFLLWHTHFDESLDGGEDVKLIGVYSTKELAENALVRMSKVEGFRDRTAGFEISEYKIDKDNWTSGFITE